MPTEGAPVSVATLADLKALVRRYPDNTRVRIDGSGEVGLAREERDDDGNLTVVIDLTKRAARVAAGHYHNQADYEPNDGRGDNLPVAEKSPQAMRQENQHDNRAKTPQATSEPASREAREVEEEKADVDKQKADSEARGSTYGGTEGVGKKGKNP